MEFTGTRENKVNELRTKIKGQAGYVNVALDIKEATTEISTEEMQFLMLENSRQQLIISKVFLWVFVIVPVVGSVLYALLYK
jgi:hypothetical protein